MKTSSLRGAIYLTGMIGLLVSIFSAAEFYTASLRSVCSINQFLSCGAVDKSGLTTTLGIQDYLWGIGGFVVLLVVAGLAERRPRDIRPAFALAALASGAVGLSAYFIYVQVAEIHAICIVCVTAETFGGILWIGSLALAARTARKAARDRSDAVGRPTPTDRSS
jgi:uncharacterized membrane protein